MATYLSKQFFIREGTCRALWIYFQETPEKGEKTLIFSIYADFDKYNLKELVSIITFLTNYAIKNNY